MTSKVGIDASSVEEASGGGNIGVGVPLKKGPWTKEEDAILMDYVKKHGEGCWSSVQKQTGLARGGKSCRLRWANHLRPDLKKGAFTPEEEDHIIELHAKIGNKWSRMAAEFPGRTDNDIKNYWNTRLKRQRRAELSVCPPDVCFQAFSENKENKDLGTFSSANSYPDLLPINSSEIPAVELKNLEPSQQLYPPGLLNIAASSFLDIPATSLLDQGLNSPCNTRSVLSTMHPSKRIQGSESWFSDLNVDLFEARHQYQNDGSLLAQSLEFSSPYTHNLTSDHHPSFSVEIPGSHAPLNGNSSSSEPKWGKKLELPSLQTQMASWGSPSPLSSLEYFDTLIQSPPNQQTDSGSLSPRNSEYFDTLIQSPPNQQTDLGSLSPRNSGLLDAILYESQTCRVSKNTSCDVVDDSCPDLQKIQWGTYTDPISPSGHSIQRCLVNTPLAMEVHWMNNSQQRQ
ncbi:hypothetical protein HAX54_032029 [Datura stramonium]|uniref:Uncharacterized protein n=1 Tax=Datura stramonium TaxID=4076 RepID=A0ABS8VAX1_DATST|nr:hypothetical protein [Datura stramonium]